jgi:hypothetical protein
MEVGLRFQATWLVVASCLSYEYYLSPFYCHGVGLALLLRLLSSVRHFSQSNNQFWLTIPAFHELLVTDELYSVSFGLFGFQASTISQFPTRGGAQSGFRSPNPAMRGSGRVGSYAAAPPSTPQQSADHRASTAPTRGAARGLNGQLTPRRHEQAVSSVAQQVSFRNTTP